MIKKKLFHIVVDYVVVNSLVNQMNLPENEHSCRFVIRTSIEPTNDILLGIAKNLVDNKAAVNFRFESMSEISERFFSKNNWPPIVDIELPVIDGTPVEDQ